MNCKPVLIAIDEMHSHTPTYTPNYATPTIKLWEQWQVTDNVVTKNSIKKIIENRAKPNGVLTDIQAGLILIALTIAEQGFSQQ